MRNTKKRPVWRGTQALVGGIVALAIIATLVFVTWGRDIPVLNPHGTIADQQYWLIMITVGLGAFVIIPVFILLFTIAWKYRASNTKAKYEPDFATHKGFEALWWGIPLLIIGILALITVISTHALDPYKKIQSNVTPVKIQVVSLEWKWLFIYPDYNVATLNYMNIPKNTPIDMSLTSDAPMNSFWIPALAGQVYTMTGMSTQLHIMADSVGTFNGSSANISGEGFADMHFKVYSQNETDFETWARNMSHSPDMLDDARYKKLAISSVDTSEKTFMLMSPNLYQDIIMKYSYPATNSTDNNAITKPMNTSSTEGMNM